MCFPMELLLLAGDSFGGRDYVGLPWLLCLLPLVCLIASKQAELATWSPGSTSTPMR